MDEGHYTITVDHELRLVQVVARGEIEREMGDELITNARMAAAEHQYNILCDVRGSHTKVSLADWYYLPRRLLVYRNAKTRQIKTALVAEKGGDQERVFRFFETVTRNLGLRIRVFFSEEDASQWLSDANQGG